MRKPPQSLSDGQCLFRQDKNRRRTFARILRFVYIFADSLINYESHLVSSNLIVMDEISLVAYLLRFVLHIMVERKNNLGGVEEVRRTDSLESMIGCGLETLESR